MSRLRDWFRKKNQQFKYERIVKHIRENNNCPHCGSGDPDVAKIYQNKPAFRNVADEDAVIWVAALNCTLYGCNTSWTAPQALNHMM